MTMIERCGGVVVPVLLGIAAVVGWGSPRLDLPTDADRATDRVRQLIPAGTDASTARRLLEDSGFRCVIARDEPGFRADVDHLWCDRQDRGLLITKRWQVTADLADGKVSTLHVTFGLIGP
jgi:hypothetical protein